MSQLVRLVFVVMKNAQNNVWSAISSIRHIAFRAKMNIMEKVVNRAAVKTANHKMESMNAR